jgi:hypothetical protein
MDMLFVIFRRVLKREPIGAPDRLHFHQLIMRGLGLSFFNRMQQNVTNPLATTLVLPMTAVPITASQFLWYVIGQSAVALLFFGALFIVTHRSSSSFRAHLHVINAQRQRQMPWSQIHV